MTAGFTGAFAIGCANGLSRFRPFNRAVTHTRDNIGFITLRLFALWDHRKVAKIVLFTAFGVSYVAVLVLFIFALKDIYGTSQSTRGSTATLSRTDCTE